MSIFIDDKDKLDIGILETYTGKDEILQLLSTAYHDVYERFFNNGLNVVFIHPKIKKGEKLLPDVPAIRQESIPWTTTIRTKAGDRRLRYCESAVLQPNGGYKFSPSHLDIEEPKWTYFKTDIDKILYLMVGAKHYLNGIISIVDTHATERKKAESRGKSGAVEFHIYTNGGDLYNNEEKLNQFCQAWGISIKNKFEEQKKNELADAIALAEQKHEWDYGYEAFAKAIKDLDPMFETRSAVQEALEKGVIKWVAKQYQVQYANNEVLLKIPIPEAINWKKLLFDYLSKHPEALDIIGASNEVAPTHTLRKLETPEVITEEYIMGASQPDLKILTQEITGLGYKDLNKMKKTELQDTLKKWYIEDAKSRP
jgi:hypothetical protein